MENGKELIQQYIKSYESSDPDKVKAFLHPSHTYYPPRGGKPMDLDGRMGDEAFFFKAFTNIKTSVEDQIAEKDRIANRISMHCTHTGDYQGVPATNKRIAITYMDIVQFKDGKILKEWAEFDMLSIVNQLQ